MLAFYPEFSRPDLGLFRGPGAGLGNLLFAWARAKIYASESGGHVIQPTWRNLKLGPILRREADTRTYGDLFHHRTLSRFTSDILIRARAKLRISEEDYLSRSYQGGNALIYVSGVRDGFLPLEGYSALIGENLRAISRHLPESIGEMIAVHIRCGDFAPAPSHYLRNTRVPIEWFVDEVARVRSSVLDAPALIFTDDKSGSVAKAFRGVPDVRFAEPRNAVVDILRLSSASHIVLSNSTFSLWGSYLGTGTVSTKYPELYADYGLRSPSFLQRVR